MAKISNTHHITKNGKVKRNPKRPSSPKKQRWAVNYMNKDKGFRPDKKVFDSYQKAVMWARKNLEGGFDPDMITLEGDDADW